MGSPTAFVSQFLATVNPSCIQEPAPLRRFALHVVAVFALLPWLGQFSPAEGQIYEWVDSANDRHFANSTERIPEEERSSATLIVKAGAAPSGGDAPTAAGEDDDAEAPESDEASDEDAIAQEWEEGFRAGWEEGFRAASEEQAAAGAEPVVVVVDPLPPIVNVPRYDPTGAYYLSPYTNTVHVPFDDGASRGLTRRRLVQNIRSTERGW